jgi:Fe2+ or Zn2+ uptake regulation protein
MPLSPQHILDQGKVLHPPLGLVTVYRMLNLLVDMNLVRRVHFESGCHGYLPASPGHHHAVICQVCGQASEFPGDGDLEPLLARVESWTGYRVEEHLLQLYGLCPTCQKSTSSPEG